MTLPDIIDDQYDRGLKVLRSLPVGLYGGYYEPKSNRDKQLADELYAVLMKHTGDGKLPREYVS